MLYCFFFWCKVLCLVFIKVVLIHHLILACFSFQGLYSVGLNLWLSFLLLLFVLGFIIIFSRLGITVLFHPAHLLGWGRFVVKVNNDIGDLLIAILYFKLLFILFSRSLELIVFLNFAVFWNLLLSLHWTSHVF